MDIFCLFLVNEEVLNRINSYLFQISYARKTILNIFYCFCNSLINTSCNINVTSAKLKRIKIRFTLNINVNPFVKQTKLMNGVIYECFVCRSLVTLFI